MKSKITLNQTLNRTIFVLSLIGIIIAIYVLQGFIRQTPIVCVNTGCELVRKSSLSYPFGIPVPAFGLVGYTLIAILSFLRTIYPSKRLLLLIMGFGLFGVSFVSWFTYVEVVYIKAVCTWCAISGVNMMIVFLLSLKSYMIERHKGKLT